jgi:hypothetical protein
MDPATIMMVLSALSSIKGMLEPAPQKPDMGEYQPPTQDTQDQYVSTLKRRIGGQTEGSVRKLITNQAGRGMLRSGPTATGEAEIRGAGDNAIAEAIANYLAQIEQEKNRWNIARYSGDMAGYNQDMSQYYGLMGGSGKNLADLGMKWAEMYGGGGSLKTGETFSDVEGLQDSGKFYNPLTGTWDVANLYGAMKKKKPKAPLVAGGNEAAANSQLNHNQPDRTKPWYEYTNPWELGD